MTTWSLVAHQVLEQAEFARLQVDLLAGAVYRTAQQIHMQVGHLHFGDSLATLAHRTPGDGLESRHEFGEGEGLADVVIGAGTQALDLVVHLAERAQYQRGRGVAGCPQASARC